VLILENNQWAYSTPVSRQVPIREILPNRALAYGIRGSDCRRQRRSSLSTKPPKKRSMIAAPDAVRCVNRSENHAYERGTRSTIPRSMCPRQMFDYWKARDPIALFEKYLTENIISGTPKAKGCHRRAYRTASSTSDQKFAEESPLPPPELAEARRLLRGMPRRLKQSGIARKPEVMPPACEYRSCLAPFPILAPCGRLLEAIPKPAISARVVT
jgi:hypothetical protein